MTRLSKLNNCVAKFYENCKNAPTKCNLCVAGRGKQDFYYDPYINLDEEHPAKNWKEQKQNKQKILRRAKQSELKLAKTIARNTIRSGAVNHDGDILVAEEVRVEVKNRGSRKSWNVTTSEYDKGIQQGIDVFAVEIERPDNGQKQILYCCTEDFFTSLVCIKLKQQQ